MHRKKADEHILQEGLQLLKDQSLYISSKVYAEHCLSSRTIE
jgi:hypothetical protein